MNFVQMAPTDTQWVSSYDQFWEEILMRFRKRRPKPGPGGIPYLVFLLEGPDVFGPKLLYEVYLSVVNASCPPQDFVEACMVFIPKDVVDPDGKMTLTWANAKQGTPGLCASATAIQNGSFLQLSTRLTLLPASLATMINVACWQADPCMTTL